VFRRAHSVAPWTLPSHGSMFTGGMPAEHGADWTAFAKPGVSLEQALAQRFAFPQPERLLPARLKRLGYRTLGFSSNAWVSRRTGFEHGFDAFYELWLESDTHRKYFGWLPPKVRTFGHLPLELATLSEFDDGDAGKQLRVFREHVAREPLRAPFFLFFNFIDAHFPYSPPPSWRYAFTEDRELAERMARFEFPEMALTAGARPIDVRRFSPLYDAELLYLDEGVGRLLAWLREKGLYDSALIIAVSDHGEHLGENGHFSHQFSVDEELLAIPLIVKLPGNRLAGTSVDDPRASNLDVYETLLRAARAGPAPAAEASASRDLSSPAKAPRQFLIAEYPMVEAFLEAAKRANPHFDPVPHRGVRHVVYDGRSRTEFVQRPGGALEVVARPGANASAARAARAALEAYLRALKSRSLVPSGGVADPETLERLRSLGYVD
jgi:arylsulfatase A-like enzyme